MEHEGDEREREHEEEGIEARQRRLATRVESIRELSATMTRWLGGSLLAIAGMLVFLGRMIHRVDVLERDLGRLQVESVAVEARRDDRDRAREAQVETMAEQLTELRTRVEDRGPRAGTVASGGHHGRALATPTPTATPMPTPMPQVVVTPLAVPMTSPAPALPERTGGGPANGERARASGQGNAATPEAGAPETPDEHNENNSESGATASPQ